MFTPQSLTIALLMMATSAVCWGSWANVQKLTKKGWRFELLYWDFVLGLLALTLILGLTLGGF